MKKLITLLVCFIAIYTISFSQTPYLPTEQLEAARTEAAKILTEPQLISVATVNGTIPGIEFAGVPIPLAFDMNEGASLGKATGWVYFFNSVSEPQNIQAIAIGVTGFGVMPFNLTALGTDLGALSQFVSPTSFESKQWMNSDAMVPYLKASAAYTGFMYIYPTSGPKYVILGSAEHPNLDPDTPYWFVMMHDPADSLWIAVNAMDGTVTGVGDDNLVFHDINIYPNPAVDYATVQLQSLGSIEPCSIKLYDNQGIVLIDFGSTVEKSIKLNFKQIINGNYFINLNIGNRTKALPIVIQK